MPTQRHQWAWASPGIFRFSEHSGGPPPWPPERLGDFKAWEGASYSLGRTY